jgi:NTE family protein
MHQNLRRIPFFSELPGDVLKAISARLHLERYKKGEVVFAEGGSGDSMYLIESGQVKVVSNMDGEERLFAYLGPGNFFGEMALLLSEPRSATVKVDIDAELWVLHKADMDELLKQYPSIAVTISRELSRRLRETDQQPIRRHEYRVVAVIGERIGELALSLARQTGEQVLLFDLGGLRHSELDFEALSRSNVTLLDSQSTSYLMAGGLAESLGSLVEKFDRALLCILPQKSEVASKAIELADVTVQIGSGKENWVEQLAVKVKRHWHVANEPAAIDRAARRLAQRLVGLALSSGGARGIAHIGVLRVLEEEGIPIDLIAGASAGSLFGALYAAGLSLDEITDFALDLKNKVDLRGRLWDFNLPPRSGLIRGQRTLGYLDKTLGHKTFSDLKTPLYVVAADVISGEEVILDSQSVAEAVRASISVIGVFSPASVQKRYLIDGGAVNPVPTGILAQKGADIIIASSVISGLEEQARQRREKEEESPPNFLGVVMNMMGIMEREIIKTKMIPVNVVINPKVGIYGFMEFDKAKELIRLGEEAAQEEIGRIKELISPRRGG